MVKRIEADYVIETPDDPRRAAEAMAGEQSSGTFMAVPGETPELQQRSAARVECLTELGEVETPSLPGRMTSARYRRAKVTLSWPLDNIGPEITSNPIQHVRLKPPARTLRGDEIAVHIISTDWHQDRAVAHEEGDGTQMVTVWLAISDATLTNGCLEVIPGKPRMYPHCPKRQTSIADGFINEADARPLPVKAGGAVIFHPLTPHAAADNMSEIFRWSFDIRYNVTGQHTGRAHFPDFVARSRKAPDTELRDWEIWRDMWLDARARLAPEPHIPIHRWTGDSPACA